MVKKISAPLERTARLLDLVPYINSHQGISLKELAHVFNVTQAQMTNDLTTLWMCGLPGYTPLELMDLEFESGYVTIRNAPTLAKPRSISFDEGVALILGLDLLASSLTTDKQNLASLIEDLKTKISTKIGLPVSMNAQPKSSPQVTSALNDSISKNSYLIIKYHSLYRDEVSERTIQPMELVQENANQYVRAFCFSAGAMRDFRVDRIIEATQTSEPPVGNEATVTSTSIDFTISLKKPSRDVVERFDVKYSDISKNLRLQSFSQQWIERSVMASGDGVELASPLNIRADIASKAQLILDRYKAV